MVETRKKERCLSKTNFTNHTWHPGQHKILMITTGKNCAKMKITLRSLGQKKVTYKVLRLSYLFGEEKTLLWWSKISFHRNLCHLQMQKVAMNLHCHIRSAFVREKVEANFFNIIQKRIIKTGPFLCDGFLPKQKSFWKIPSLTSNKSPI